MNIEKELKIDDNFFLKSDLAEKQASFLDSMLGNAINTGIDIGIRTIFPDFFENQVINLKNNLIEFGLNDGIKKTIDDTLNLGKSAIGVATGKFESLSQMQLATKEGGVIDTFSDALDTVFSMLEKNSNMNPNTLKMIKNGKNIILNNIEGNIEKSFKSQFNGQETLGNHIERWKNYYNEKDFENMEIEYKNITKEIIKLAPLEKTLKEARTVENLHNLIKNNGHRFELNETEKELLKKLS